MFDIWKNFKDLLKVNYHHVSSANTVHSTFTRGRLINEKWGYEAEDDDEPEISPGIRPAIEGDDPRIFHSYYQWVWAVLFMQGGIFYIPYWIWKYCDRGRIKMLVSDLNLKVLSDEAHVAKEKEAIIRYFTPNKGHHTLWACQYIGCELLNFLNVIWQMYATNVFLNYEFTLYGLNIFNMVERRPYASKVFPVVTACRLATGGPAFNSVEYDLLCILPINILNEKIYVFLWFWFTMLGIVSTLNIIYRIFVICIPPLRSRLLLRHVRMRKGYRLSDLKMSYGDWFLMYKLGENLNPIVFSELLHELVENAEDQDDDDEKKSLTKASLLNEEDGNKSKSNSVIERL